jgi:hypothetical protein
MIRILFAALFLLAGTPAAAQAGDPAGTWALRTGGRILAIFELRRDATAPGGWAGGWLRPEHFGVNTNYEAVEVSGPIVRRPILRATARGAILELHIRGATDEDDYTFELRDGDTAIFGWINAPIEPMELQRVAADTRPDSGPWDASRAYPLARPVWPPNTEMKAIFDADQADRRAGAAIDWSMVLPRDRERRARTRTMLDAGALHTGEDFYHAAFIFQHGEAANDFLVAHTLAMAAAARGFRGASWIAAATLDRYLQRIGRPQVYGTQYQTPPDQPVTQDPYDRTVISDGLRRAIGVPDQAGQELQRQWFEAEARVARERRTAPPATARH